MSRSRLSPPANAGFQALSANAYATHGMLGAKKKKEKRKKPTCSVLYLETSARAILARSLLPTHLPTRYPFAPDCARLPRDWSACYNASVSRGWEPEEGSASFSSMRMPANQRAPTQTSAHQWTNPMAFAQVSPPLVYCALNVLPLAVFRSFSSLSGLARRRTWRKSAVRRLMREWMYALEALMW